MTDKRSGQEDVRRLLTRVLAQPRALVELPPSELDLALRAARRGGVLGRLAAALEAEGRLNSLPLVARDQLVSARVMSKARSRLVTWELNRVISALGDDELRARVVVLKGCAYLLAGFPNSCGRSTNDLDLLIPEDELASVEQCLLRHGWRSEKLTPYDQHYYRAWTHELPPLVHPDRAVEVDLHHNILPPTARLTPDARQLWLRAESVPGTPVERLSNDDLVLHAIVHLFFDSDLTDRLRDLVDIDLLLRHFSAADDRFCFTLVDRASILGLLRPTYYALRYAKRLLQTPVPADAEETARTGAPAKWVVLLMDSLIDRAIFPQHPDRPSFASGLARLCLYLRSHWIRMPPWLLVRHLSYKTYLTTVEKLVSTFKPSPAPSSTAPTPRPAPERTRATPRHPPTSTPSS